MSKHPMIWFEYIFIHLVIIKKSCLFFFCFVFTLWCITFLIPKTCVLNLKAFLLYRHLDDLNLHLHATVLCCPGFVCLHRQLLGGWDSVLLVITSAEAHGAESISLWKAPDYHRVGGVTTTCGDTQVLSCGCAVLGLCRQLRLILSLPSKHICPWEVSVCWMHVLDLK